MNLRAKFVFSIALLGLLCFMLPGSLRADTVYTYTGNPYDECSGSYVTTGGCLGAMSVTFTVKAGTPLTNLGFADISSDVTMFSFSDGVSGTITQSNACLLCAGGKTFIIGTDAGGHITNWAMSTKTGMVAPLVVYDAGGSYLTNPPQVFDFTNTATITSGIFGGDDRFGAPGIWTNSSGLANFGGGTPTDPRPLPLNGPIGQIEASIGGNGSNNFYEFNWGGGAFGANGSVAGANPDGSYEFELLDVSGNILDDKTLQCRLFQRIDQ